MASFGSNFGGFGQNTAQQNTGFGGFGSNTTSNPGGFGSTNTGAFGANNNSNTSTGTGLFGNAGAFGSGPTSGFGSNTGGFGANKTAFGSSTTGTGGLFGGNNPNNSNTAASTNNASTGFGGFGSNTTNNSNTFGTGSASLFGGNKNTGGFGGPALTNAGGGLFGGNNSNAPSNTSTFGTTTGGGFGGALNNPGIGANVGDPPGTAIAPFQAYTEKEANNNTTNAFQNITFQEPYKKWSTEELRLTDYAQGRRHGNASGGAGAFGVGSGFGSTGFSSNATQTGGFGANTNTSSGLFGGNTSNATNAFGTSNTSGFGNTQSGSLFGNKPATTGFGAPATQPNTSGGMFGGFTNNGSAINTNATSTFASSNNAGGGIFGNTANQNKPAGFGFGTTNTNTTLPFNSNTANNAFGASSNPQQGAGGGLFNTGNASQATGPSLFNNNQQNASGGFGTNSGFGTQTQQQNPAGGIFGNNAAKPAALLFNTANNGSSGGIFGNTTNANTNTSGFGTNSGAAGGLFGPKPAGSTGNIFGNTTTPQPGGTGAGLFGNMANNSQPQQQNTSTAMFSTLGQNNAQQKPSLFGNSSQPTNNPLFASSTVQPQNSLFGNNNQQQQQGATLGGSLLGPSHCQNTAPQGLTASLTDISAYGSSSLFANLGGSVASNPGPLATPMFKSTQRRSSVLPMYKLNPASASRMATPQKRGFGLSLGTPSNATTPTSTPGNIGRSLLGSSAGRSLSKSVSSNSLRRTFNAEDSILTPGAFSSSTTSRPYSSVIGSAKKLNITHQFRSDLFSSPSKDKTPESSYPRKLSKRVSFDEAESSSHIGLLTNGTDSYHSAPTQPAGSSSTPNNGQLKGKELTSVPEEDLDVLGKSLGREAQPELGPYELDPAWDVISKMSPSELASVSNFHVSRENVGSIAFRCPVDLRNVSLEDLTGNVIRLEPRKATVYPSDMSTPKPPRGSGLNVPADITIHRAWPRNTSRRDKASSTEHARKLALIPQTQFKSYDSDTGAWYFGVEHFTTYGVDGSDATDDEYDEDDIDDVPMVDGVPTAPASMPLPIGDPRDDDTVAFRKNRLPGAFCIEAGSARTRRGHERGESFLGSSSAGSPTNEMRLLDDIPGHMDDEYDVSENDDVTRHSFRQLHTTGQDDFSSDGEQDKTQAMPVSILRARARAQKEAAGPLELQVADGNDWMEMLRKSVSPIKGDRQALRAIQDTLRENETSNPEYPSSTMGPSFEDRLNAIVSSPTKARRNRESGNSGKLGLVPDLGDGRGFSNSIDLMRFLFDEARTASSARRVSPAKGFVKWPYGRQDKTGDGEPNEVEASSHRAIKPSWGPQGIVVYTTGVSSGHNETVPITSSKQGLCIGHLSGDSKASSAMLQTQMRLSAVAVNCHSFFVNGERRSEMIPSVQLNTPTLVDLVQSLDGDSASVTHEKLVWELASILFDRQPLADGRRVTTESLARKTRLSQFWKSLVHRTSITAANLASSYEEKAIAYLSGNLVPEACKQLLDGRDFHLATLVSLIGASEQAKASMREQIQSWRKSDMLSEFSEPIRALYELLGGNVCCCEGVLGVPIEDRVSRFIISERFDLDWKRAFGLRLWYAISKDEDISAAVSKFESDITAGEEKLPQPWYREQGFRPLWDDKNAENRQDILWGLLQLYSAPSVDLQSVLRPENSQLSPLDSRLSWQLGIALLSTGKVNFGAHGAEKLDASTLSFASQLSNEGNWINAIFVLLHLGDPVARLRAIQELLGRNAGSIGLETNEAFKTLVNDFKIPTTWIWEARALFMRSVRGDHAGEVECLLRAGVFTEAHRVLVDHVAPVTVVEQDYESLSVLVSPFRGREGSIPEWATGGEIYDTFLEFVKHGSRNQAIPPSIITKLVSGLPEMEARLETSSGRDYVKHAAVTCMADEVSKVITQNKELLGNAQALPLTSDRRLHYAMNLIWNCFSQKHLVL